ncbi:MAG: fibronectin type III domain-containing protein [Lachnospira sp.]|nr:fibronectin type III domain-containing protein [Lachnospira sp.]
MKKMNKKLILIIAVIAVIIGCTSVASAETVGSGTCGDNITWTLDSGGVLTLSGTGETYEYGSYGSEERAPWYRNAYDVKSAVIEEGITGVFYGLFLDCKNLEKVYFPSTLECLDYGTFTNCNSVKEVHVADLANFLNLRKNSDYYLTNGRPALYVGDALVKELVIPEGVPEIRQLSGYSSIEKVVIPQSVTKIHLGAFDECFKLKEVVIEGNPEVVSHAFTYCPLQSVVAPNLDSSKMNVFDGVSITTSGHKTSSVTINWAQYPNVKKIEIYRNNKLVTTINDTERTSYTLKGERDYYDDCAVRFYYDDGISPELRYFKTWDYYFAYKPYKTTISKLTTGSKYVKVQWKENKSSEVDGYQIQIATNSKFTAGKKTYTVKDTYQLSKKITNLKKNKKYYVRVRAFEDETPYYSEDAPVKRVYGSWSDVKSITCK